MAGQANGAPAPGQRGARGRCSVPGIVGKDSSWISPGRMHSNSFTPGSFINGNSKPPATMPPTWHHQATSLLVAAPRLMNWIAMNTPMIQ